MRMEVIRAETAGFCFGVALALKRLDKLIEKVGDNGKIRTLGPIIHNPQVLEQYARLGVGQIREPEDVPPGYHVVIRAHGISKEALERLKLRGVNITDATCPKVRKAQVLIAEQTEMGKTLLLFGEEDHPEVRGLLSRANPDAAVFDTLDKLDSISLDPTKEYFLAAQTTQDECAFAEVEDRIRERLGRDVTVLDTICDATRRRQEEAIAIARQVEFMVIVGGYTSGNTRRLVKVVEAADTPCLQVETPDELPADKLRQYAKIGLTAGASTPKSVIDEVQARLESL